MLKLHVLNETDRLEAVVLGIADSPGPVPSLEDAYDPKSKEFIRRGEYPVEKEMVGEMDALAAVFEKYNVKVYRPKNLKDVNQVFTRDIAFVIGDTLVVANVLEDRAGEFGALAHLVEEIDPAKVVEMPDNVRVEGGDVMPWNGKLFMGYSEPSDFENFLVARTNRAGVEFLKSRFPEWEVHAFQLVKSDDDPRGNSLHLDCCFQPIGRDRGIIFPEGFKNPADVDFLRSFFGHDRLIEITREEMYQMSSNVFSISPDVIVSERGFTRLNSELRHLGFTVEEVPYSEIGKQEGLLRCSTLPLRRKA